MTEGFGVYLHFPYCPVKCHYCDFNAYRLPRDEGARARMAGAIADEVRRAPGAEIGRTASSVYLGGGTPSLFPPREIGVVLDAVARRYGIARDAELTIECNPGTVGPREFRELRAIGLNRVSLGAQTFDPGLLQALGRDHSPEDTRRAARDLVQAGFRNWSLDLMYGLPGQTREMLKRSVRTALTLQPPHVSAYALELEQGTLFGHLAARGRLALPDDGEVVQAGEEVAALLAAGGLRRYEVSNFAQPGRESRHNLLYWHQGEYRGFGPGAHSHIGHRRFWNAAPPGQYLRLVERRGEAVAGDETLEGRALMGEWIYLRLRLSDGFSLSSFFRRFGLPLEAAYPGVRAELLRAGLLQAKPGRIAASDRGRWLLHRVASPFLP